MTQNNKIAKAIYSGWEKACRGELVVFFTCLFSLGVILILATIEMNFKMWSSFGFIYAVFFTRYLTMWIDRRKNDTN